MSTRQSTKQKTLRQRFSVMLAALGLALAGMTGVTSPARAEAFDDVLLSGSGWLGGQGVTVYSNGSPNHISNDYSAPAMGMKWQCVELAQRLYNARGWHSGFFSNVAIAADIFTQASSNGMTKQANGSITSVVPGDMLVFSGGGGSNPGHVGIINTISNNSDGTKTLTVINQNTYEVLSTVIWNTTNNTVSKYGYMDSTFAVMGIVHDPNNTAASQPVPADVAAADFNIDGKSDIAWYTAANGGTVSALVSTGTSFNMSGIATGYAIPTWAGVGNFNADNRGDIAWYQESNHTLYLLKANASGAWQAGAVLEDLEKPTWAGVGDFNRDGMDDIAWYTTSSNGKITALLSTGTSFSMSTIATGYAIPTWADTGDFNGDGRDDIAWYQESDHKLYLLKGDNAGNWQAGAVLENLGKPKWAGTGDFTKDGKTDIAWYISSNGKITVLQSTGTSFSSSGLVTGYAIPVWAGVDDYNNDGRDDIAWYQSNQTLYLLKGNDSGVWQAGAVKTGVPVPAWAGNGSPPL